MIYTWVPCMWQILNEVLNEFHDWVRAHDARPNKKNKEAKFIFRCAVFCLGFQCLSSFLLLWKLPTKTCLCAVCSAKLLQSRLTLCDPVDCSPPGSSVHGVLQARILEWAAMPSSRGTSQPRDWTHVSYISCFGRWVLYHLCHLGSPRKSEDVPDSTLKCSFFRDRLLSWYKSKLS